MLTNPAHEASHEASHEAFAEAGDALLRSEEPNPTTITVVAEELAVARRLRRTASSGRPDPEFVAGLREELRLLAQARSRPIASMLRYATLETALGPLAIAYRDGKVLYCSRLGPQPASFSLSVAGRSGPPVEAKGLGEAETRAPAASPESGFVRAVARELGAWPERDPAPPPAMERAIRDHLAGRRRFTAVDLSALTPFQRRVLEKTAEIPRGEIRPYGWVAREIGAPGATRAVGTALGHNPVPFLIPCHRVVRSDGTLGEYSGGGPAVKARVLEQEGAPIDEIVQAARSGHRYRGSRTTHIVCYPTCHAARRIQPENVVPFASLAQARGYGYRPCSLCRPA